jgi:ribosomal protein S27E
MPQSHAHQASAPARSSTGYLRHRPEATILYQTVERFYPAFLEHLAAQGRTLPRYVRREFEEYLKCGRLEYGFMRVRCELCHHEKLIAQLQAPWVLSLLRCAAHGRECSSPYR